MMTATTSSRWLKATSWSDGSAMTADDMMATFNIFRLRGDAVWANMSGIEKVDDYYRQVCDGRAF